MSLPIVRENGRYLGGPLDGQEAKPVRGGRWPVYRDNVGKTLPLKEGDAEFVVRWTTSQLPARKYYTRQHGQATTTVDENGQECIIRDVVYVYGPDLQHWFHSRRSEPTTA